MEESSFLEIEGADLVARLASCAQLSESLTTKCRPHDLETALRRSEELSRQLKHLAADFAHNHSLPTRISNNNISFQAAQKCFEAEREGLLREIRVLEERNRKIGRTISGLQERKEREEHLAKKCRSLQDCADETMSALHAEKRRTKSLVEEVNGLKKTLQQFELDFQKRDEMKKELEERLSQELKDSARSLREQENIFEEKLNSAERERSELKDSLHKAKMDLDETKVKLKLQQTISREKGSNSSIREEQLLKERSQLRAAVQESEDRVFLIEEEKIRLQNLLGSQMAELGEETLELRSKLESSEAKREEMELENATLRTQAKKHVSNAEKTALQINNLNKTKTTLKGSLVELREKFEASKRENLRLKENAKFLQEESETLHDEHDETLSKSALNESHASILSRKCDAQTEEVKSLNAEIFCLQEEVQRLQTGKIAADHSAQRAHAALEALKKVVQELYHKRGSNNNNNGDFTRQLKTCQSRVSEMQQHSVVRIKKLEMTISELRQTIHELTVHYQ